MVQPYTPTRRERIELPASLYDLAKSQVVHTGGVSPPMVSRLIEAGYTPEHIDGLVNIWRTES